MVPPRPLAISTARILSGLSLATPMTPSTALSPARTLCLIALLALLLPDGVLGQNASIQGRVFSDLNGNGYTDGAEDGIEGVVTFLDANGNGSLDAGERTSTTDNLGTLFFDGLDTGTYLLRVVLPGASWSQTAPAGGEGQSVTINQPDQFVDFIDFGIAESGAIEGTIWADQDGNDVLDSGEGLASIDVLLFRDSAGKSSATPVLVAQTVTASAGGFSIPAPPGAGYFIASFPPSTYSSALTPFSWNGASGFRSGNIGLVASQVLTLPNSSGHMISATCSATLGDAIWLDANRDGVFDTSESGLGSVTLTATGYGADGILGTSDDTSASTTTAADGSYDFTGLCADTYRVVVTASTLPSGLSVTGDPDATLDGMTDVVIATNSDDHDAADFGYAGTAEIGDRVWEDLDGDGIQDAGEPGLNAIQLTLVGPGGDGTLGTADDTVEATTSTNSAGQYTFTGVRGGSWIIRVDPASLPSPSFTPSYDVDGGLDNESIVTVSAGASFLLADFGYAQGVSLSGMVWHDLNADGLRQTGESGEAGVLVSLFTGSSTTPVQTAVTDAAGAYTLATVLPASYRLGVGPGPYALRSPQDIGSDDAIDSDVSASTGEVAFTAASGATLTFDAGLYDAASVGDYVWEDANGNGIQDGGELGLAAVNVDLLDSALSAVSSAVTSAAGAFSFTGLTPGTYTLRFTPPSGAYQVTPAHAGTNAALDSDADPSGNTAAFTLVSGSNISDLDAGYVQQATLGDLVWEDTNGNGLQDSGEPGLAGVDVRLLDGSGATLTTTTTGSLGAWSHGPVNPGTYQLEFVLPAGYSFTLQNQGTNDLIDSDVDGIGRTGPFSLTSGATANRWDAGAFPTAFVSFVDPGSTTADEATGPFGVQVKLEIPGGGTLASGVTVTASDVGTGTATSGADYTAFSAATVSFASGSADGATSTMWVTILDDAVSEGTETIDAEMVAITGPSLIGSPNAHRIEITDDDGPQILVTPLAGHVLPEPGGSSTFTVVLNGLPSADVTVALTSSDLTEGTVSPSSLTFTSSNGTTPQTVTVSSVNDDIDDGDVSWTAVTGAASSSDASFNGIDPSDVVILTQDEDVAGISILSISGASTDESGSSYSVTVTLDSEPTADVVIGFSSSDATEGAVSPASLTFTSADWSMMQSVTATGVDDSLLDGDIAYDLVSAPAVSADAVYNGLDAVDVSLINTDDDIVVCDAGGPFYAYEDQVDYSATLTMSGVFAGTSLLTNYTHDGDGTEFPLFTLVSTSATSTGFAIEALYIGEHDLVIDGDQTVTYTFTLSSDDPNWDGLSCDYEFINVDNGLETAYLRMSDPLEAAEDETAQTERIELIPDNLATSAITWNVATDGDGTEFDLAISGNNSGGTLTYTGLQDCTVDGDQSENVTVSLSSAQAAYDGTSITVTANNVDSASNCLATVGNYVWYDRDADGIQDPRESAASGVSVVLYRSDGTLYSIGSTAFDGSYSITAAAGDYVIGVIPPSGYGVAPMDSGSSDRSDSDVDPVTLRSDVFTLSASQNLTTLDIGLVQSLCGSYTIGTSGDYATFADAADALRTYGVSCAVTMELQGAPAMTEVLISHSFSETVEISGIGGVSSTNTVTFQGSYGALVFYSPSSTRSPAFHIISDHIHFRDMSISNTDSSEGRVFLVHGDDVSIRDCSIEVQGSDTPVHGVIDTYDGGPPPAVDNLLVAGNTITGGPHGISLHSQDTDATIRNNTISGTRFDGMKIHGEDCTVRGNTTSGIHLISAVGCLVRGNVVTGAFTISDGTEDTHISRNEVSLGMQLYRVTPDASLPVVVENNFLRGGTALEVIQGVNNTHFHHNTLYGTNTGLQIDGTNNSGLSVVNNIIVGLSTVISVEDGTSFSTFDYNQMDAATATIGHVPTVWEGTSYSSLASLQAASGMHANATDVSVDLVSSSDLHLAGSSIGDTDLRGTTSLGVSDDIDNDSRNITCPYMGADEASTPLCLTVRTIFAEVLVTAMTRSEVRVYADLDGNGALSDTEIVHTGPAGSKSRVHSSATLENAILIRVEDLTGGKTGDAAAVLFEGSVSVGEGQDTDFVFLVGGDPDGGIDTAPFALKAIPKNKELQIVNASLRRIALTPRVHAFAGGASEDSVLVVTPLLGTTGLQWGEWSTADITPGLAPWYQGMAVADSGTSLLLVNLSDDGLEVTAMGESGDPTPAPRPGSLEIFHAAAPAGTVDIAVGGAAWVASGTAAESNTEKADAAGQLPYGASTGRIAVPPGLLEVTVSRRGNSSSVPVSIASETPDRIVLGASGEWLRLIPLGRQQPGTTVSIVDVSDPASAIGLALDNPWSTRAEQEAGDWVTVASQGPARFEVTSGSRLLHLFDVDEEIQDVVIVFDEGYGFNRRNGVLRKVGERGFALTVLSESGPHPITGTPVGEVAVSLRDDLNGNGAADTGEPGVAGQSVSLQVLESDYPALVAPGVVFEGTTDSDGRHLFEGLPPGRFEVTTDPGASVFTDGFGTAIEFEHRDAFGSQTRYGRTVHVRTSEETGSTVAVTTGEGTGSGSLAEAINQLNGSSGRGTIDLSALAGKSAVIINLTAPLPPITAPLRISGGGEVVLDGSAAGEGANGLVIQTSRVSVEGLTFRGFSGHGVLIESGSTNLVQDNIFEALGGDAVRVLAGSGNAVRRNTASRVSGLILDLGGDGVTANDAQDADEGPNGLINVPTLSAAHPGSTVVSGSADGSGDADLLIDFYAVSNCPTSGTDSELGDWLGEALVELDADGQADFSVSLPPSATLDSGIAATATDASGNTSELSSCVSVAEAPVLTTLSLDPASVTLVVGEGILFRALGLDQFGASLTFSPTWSVTGGDLESDGFYTAESVGEYVITAADPITGLQASATISVVSGTGTGDGALPTDFALLQNYPNPFNPVTRLVFEVPRQGQVKISVHDLLGRLVARVADGHFAAGRHQILFDASSLSSGLYLYRMTSGDYQSVRRMTVIK